MLVKVFGLMVQLTKKRSNVIIYNRLYRQNGSIIVNGIAIRKIVVKIKKKKRKRKVKWDYCRNGENTHMA